MLITRIHASFSGYANFWKNIKKGNKRALALSRL